MFSSVLLQVVICKKNISHSCQTNFETLSSWICLLHCGGRVTLFAGGLTQALIYKTSKPNCSERLISPMMLNASKYKTTRSHRLLLKSWQNVTQLQIYRTFIFWLRWRPSSNLIVIIFPLLLVNRGSLRWCAWVRKEWDKELRKEVVCSQSCSSAGKQIGRASSF